MYRRNSYLAETKAVFKLKWKEKATGHNTRFIQFGQKYKAFAKAVAPAKDNYFRFANG